MSSKLRKLETMKVFDITRHLDSEEAMAEYLSQVLEDGDSDELIRALDHIAKARGLTPSQK
jgi:probable addiction module antidote protein